VARLPAVTSGPPGRRAALDVEPGASRTGVPALARTLADGLSARGLLLGALVALTGWLVTRPVQDPDYWWHVATGRWILAHHSLPGHDLFTYTVISHQWIDHEYLTEIGLYLVNRFLGLLGASLVFAAITLAAFWLIARRAELEPQPYVLRGLLLGLAAVAGSPFWGPRAQMLTFFFVCLELYWLERFLRRGDRALYWLPVVMVLWANLHGGFPVAFLFLSAAVAARLAEGIATREKGLRRDAGRLSLLSLACLAATFLTPNTYLLLPYVLQTQSSPVQQSLIVEWLSPDFHEPAFRPFELMVLALVAGFGLSRPRTHEVLIALATVALALQSTRHIPLFLAACTPILVRLYGEAWTKAARSRGWRLPAGRPSTGQAAVTACLLLVLVSCVGIAGAQRLAGQQALIRGAYPVAAADWLQAHPEVGSRMFNSYGWGGYLTYRFYPRSNRRVFVFGEAELMGDDQLRRYAEVESVRPDWQTELRRDGVDYVVFNRGAPLANALAVDPNWRVAYEDAVAVIYVRAGSTAVSR
jgi:hypothetical protein